MFTSPFAGTSISSFFAFLQHFLQFCFTLRDRSPKTLSCFVFHFFSESPYGTQRCSLLGPYYLDSMSGLFDCRFKCLDRRDRWSVPRQVNPLPRIGVYALAASIIPTTLWMRSRELKRAQDMVGRQQGDVAAALRWWRAIQLVVLGCFLAVPFTALCCDFRAEHLFRRFRSI